MCIFCNIFFVFIFMLNFWELIQVLERWLFIIILNRIYLDKYTIKNEKMKFQKKEINTKIEVGN